MEHTPLPTEAEIKEEMRRLARLVALKVLRDGKLKRGVFDTFHAAWKASRFTDEQYARWAEDQQRIVDAREGFDD